MSDQKQEERTLCPGCGVEILQNTGAGRKVWYHYCQCCPGCSQCDGCDCGERCTALDAMNEGVQ